MHRLLVVTVVLLFAYLSNAFAQNRVVVIPLDSDSAGLESLIYLAPDKSDDIGVLDCAVSEDCQDVFEFTLAEPATAQLRVFDVGGNSVIRLAIYAPGVALGGENILTGFTTDLECTGQNEDVLLFPVQLLFTGTYKLAITRDFGSSGGTSGIYEATLFTSKPVSFGGQIVNDEQSLASGTDCE